MSKKKDWQQWHHDWEWRDKLDQLLPIKKRKRIKSPRLGLSITFQGFLESLGDAEDEDLMDWAKDTYILWRGDDDLDHWKDAEA